VRKKQLLQFTSPNHAAHTHAAAAATIDLALGDILVMIAPPMLDQVVNPGEAAVASALAPRPRAGIQDGPMHGLVVPVQVGAAAEGGAVAMPVLAAGVLAVEAFAAVVLDSVFEVSLSC
jgi:hypothetical protein